ncbi:hypothetical protein HYPDE_34843 [Hyphomicrobium denitrificans 1NES1]|uniref:DUF2380 domain-containing protein n=1 Tax=Hyphomicrobium denitrificans 1NES1 TaxID=670307 RepID=N0BEU5_9HYPH|nr:DUF3280 domain-containing protein [Hyphomicrobium denitrificans]AGK58640.1 hypothetical protein HYPDE_34843 [Hyphomicrobium denitrificans 1NES1]
MDIQKFNQKQSVRFFAIAFFLALTSSGQAAESSPPKLAVFDFELADFSAGGPIAGESPTETARLKLVTKLARRLIEQSGRYQLVDTGPAGSEDKVKEHWLRNCNGCDADIALKLGADQSFLGTIQKLSVLVHTVVFQIRDTRTGKIILNVQTDLRGDTDESWTRSVAWLIEHRLLGN